MSHNLLLSSLDEVLLQGECLLNGLTDQQYTDKLPHAFNASIGAHYRHNLEHFKTMFESLGKPEIDYDQRARNLRIENERSYALQMTKDFREAAQFLTENQLQGVVEARCKTSYSRPETSSAASTVSREIMYTISHAIHHYALISMICNSRNIPLPEGFGIAPSTIEYQRKLAST